jgi:hypothetical protein
MWSLHRRARVTVALMALASLAALASIDARAEERHEHRPEAQRPAARREAVARPSRRAYATRAQGTSAAAHPVVSAHRQMVSHGIARGPAGPVPGARYGNGFTTFQRTIRPGFVSRTFVSGGHVLYTHVYQQHVWHQFGRAFAYETFVPAVHYPAAYYGWALAAWPHPVAYAWGWQVQPWYPVYGALFTPYPVYTSPDLWMTDYVIAQSMQAAYQAQTAAPAPQPSPAGPPAPYAPQWNPAAPAPQPSDVPPAQDSSAETPAAQPGDAQPAPPPSDAQPVPQPSAAPTAPTAAPPAITPQVKAQLNAQIKVQLREQQAAVATPATLTTQSTPPALRPNHLFFEVVQPLDVPSGIANHLCSLNANDYIKRTGDMSQDDWKIPVVVELSGPADCPKGLHTRIGLNDLNAMENEQEARVVEAMQAASKSMGPNGPQSTAGHLIADGSAGPAPLALDAIRQAE